MLMMEKKDPIMIRPIRPNVRKELLTIGGNDHRDIITASDHKIGMPMNDGQQHQTDYHGGEENDGIYCGDAIMFYPDANECNGGFQNSGKGRKSRRAPSAFSPEKPHKCMQCGASFRQRSHLKAHIRTHTGEKPFGCEVCGKTFARLDSAVRHMKIHAGTKKRASPKQSTYIPPVRPLPPPPPPPPPPPHKEPKRKRHSNEHSTKEKPYKCFDCGTAFRQQCHLKVHKRIHTGEKPFDCEVCGKTFGRKYSQLRHMKTHTEDNLQILHQEDFITPSASSSMAEFLPKLEKMHGYEKPFRCDQCTAAFTQRSHLRNHLRTHTGEKPYSCDACGKSFSRKYSAMRHMRTHTGEKRFKCGYCGNSYSQRFHLRDHMRTHTGEKPFDCPVCDKAFSRKDLAVRHLRTHSGSTSKMFDFADGPE
ncbi:uncharacterized protein [Diadema setosum]|uniref:uncharacterized protein n=1 Tax=Diadema setosum TaxID=31175 RepID=UPI003B3BB02C